jgi:hypothetical protein
MTRFFVSPIGSRFVNEMNPDLGSKVRVSHLNSVDLTFQLLGPEMSRLTINRPSDNKLTLR